MNIFVTYFELYPEDQVVCICAAASFYLKNKGINHPVHNVDLSINSKCSPYEVLDRFKSLLPKSYEFSYDVNYAPGIVTFTSIL